MPAYGYPLLLVAGFVAGFVNTLAGSGSLVTLPALLLLGLPATDANGTNRVAIVMQNVMAVGSFRQQGVFEIRPALWLALPAVLGALVGARIAVVLDEQAMRRAIGAVMLLAALNLLFRPKRWLRKRSEQDGSRAGAWTWLFLFLTGLYGGFIQVGVGFLLIACLVLGAGYGLLETHAVKVLIVLCFTAPALAVFAAHGQVDWKLGGVLGAGNMLGAWVATRLAVRRGERFLRWVLLAVALAAGVALLVGV